MVEALGKCGMGWFNLYEPDQDVYEVSPLKKLFRLVRQMMQDALRECTVASCTALGRLVAGASRPVHAAVPGLAAMRDGEEAVRARLAAVQLRGLPGAAELEAELEALVAANTAAVNEALEWPRSEDGAPVFWSDCF